MRLRHVPASRGAVWMRNGFGVFARRPLAFAALFTAFLFFALVSAMLPLIGPLLTLASLPLVSLGFMRATQHTLRGRLPTLAVFVTPLRRDRRVAGVLIRLGLAYAVATTAVMTFSDFADGGTFQALQEAMAGSHGSGEANREEIAALLGDARLQGGLLLRLTLAALLSLPFWHAPALAHWAGQGVAQALFSSTLACWRNRGAFLVYGLSWAGALVGFGVVVNVLAALFGHPQLIALVAVPAGLLFSTVFYVSLYFTFADCFAPADAAAPTAPALDAGGAEKS